MLVISVAITAVLLVAPLSAPGGAGRDEQSRAGAGRDEQSRGARVASAELPTYPVDRSATPEAKPAGTLVSLARGNRLAAIDVASGRRTVRRIQAVAGCGPELFHTAGHVVFAGLVDTKTVVFSIPVSLERPARRLGAAHVFVPSATEGRVWLAGVDCGRRRMVGVREVTVDGKARQASARRVPGTWVAAAVGDGLVLHRDRAYYVWDPRAPGMGRRLDVEAVTSAHGNLMVACAERSRCRDLVILDSTSGKEIEVQDGGYRLDGAGEFSPDGSLVAMPARADRRWSVALVDTRDGTARIVPGSDTGSSYPHLSWAASTGWLFFRAGTHVMAYRPGDPRAVELPFRLPMTALGFVAG